MPRTGAVIVAAGRGRRMRGIDKMTAPLAGCPLLLHSVRAFERCRAIDEIVVVVRSGLLGWARRLVGGARLGKVRDVVAGGEERTESSRRGLAALGGETEVVLVHDGARPLVSEALIGRVAEVAAREGAAVPGVAPVATIRREKGGASEGTLDRERLREAQTPQGFRRDLLERALEEADRGGFEGTDEAVLVERIGVRVAIVKGERRNLKVTVPEDLVMAEALASWPAPALETRIGFGRDVHRLVKGRRLVLGGVEVAHERGLEGHSDADVLCHAVCDALLGAAGRGDVGEHFPDTEERWRDVPGAELLARTLEILREVGYVPVNVDATLSAQAPRLAPYRARMIENLAGALCLAREQVCVKFTTTEGLGFEGRGEGISATAVALVRRSCPPPERG